MNAHEEIKAKLNKLIYHVDRFEIVYIMSILEDILSDKHLIYREVIDNAMDAAIMFEYDNIKKYINQYIMLVCTEKNNRLKEEKPDRGGG